MEITMTGLEIFLLIIGFGCICVSFFVSRKSNKENLEEENEGTHTSNVWTEKEEEIIKKRVEEILLERQNELVDTTEDEMSRICNEKIMAVDEFSKQLMEKIEQNHQEVVFMYNMLNEKEKEIKSTVTQPVPKPESKTVEPALEKAPQSAIQTVPKKKVPKAETKPVEKKDSITVSGNVNLQIQKMYKEGKSVLEISKALDVGQGEVKLVLALYGGKK